MKLLVRHNTEKSAAGGFTLLFAVLVSVLVLAVGASVINIALKQVILSGAGRESQYAFYAANTGVECALYWDLNGSQVVDGDLYYVFPPDGGSQIESTDALECAGGNIATGDNFEDGGTDFTGAWDSQPGQTIFHIAITDATNNTDEVRYCATVTVLKETTTDTFGNEAIKTTITSQGLNTCDPENDDRAVERGLVLQYTS
ncbi:MAG: hypothetical protein RL150_470 [Candidatus Parcubacteria bacterium]|jgi:hypothetical protein